MFCEKFNKNNDLLKLCPNIQQLEGRLSGATTRPVDGCLFWTIKNPQSQQPCGLQRILSVRKSADLDP
jgi:hypothetical protein